MFELIDVIAPILILADWVNCYGFAAATFGFFAIAATVHKYDFVIPMQVLSIVAGTCLPGC